MIPGVYLEIKQPVSHPHTCISVCLYLLYSHGRMCESSNMYVPVSVSGLKQYTFVPCGGQSFEGLFYLTRSKSCHSINGNWFNSLSSFVWSLPKNLLLYMCVHTYVCSRVIHELFMYNKYMRQMHATMFRMKTSLC